MSIEKAIVPVAGLGTRLLPTTKALAKEMLPVGRLPVIHHVVEELLAAGIRKILFVTAHNKGAIADYFDDGSELIRRLEAEQHDLLNSCRFNYRALGVEFFSVLQHIAPGQHKPAGTGDAVAAGETFVSDEPFVVAFGDSFITTHSGKPLLQRMIYSHQSRRASCTIGAFTVPENRVHHYGILIPETTDQADVRLTGILEKPGSEQTPSRLAISSRYIFSSAIFERIRNAHPSAGGEIYLTDAIDSLISAGAMVRAVCLNTAEKRHDIGNHLSYYESFVDYALDDPEWGEQIRAYMREKLAR